MASARARNILTLNRIEAACSKNPTLNSKIYDAMLPDGTYGKTPEEIISFNQFGKNLFNVLTSELKGFDLNTLSQKEVSDIINAGLEMCKGIIKPTDYNTITEKEIKNRLYDDHQPSKYDDVEIPVEADIFNNNDMCFIKKDEGVVSPHQHTLKALEDLIIQTRNPDNDLTKTTLAEAAEAFSR